MTFDWREYLALAQTLAGQPPAGLPPGPEARLRAATSRAYYAAFGVARESLVRQGVALGTGAGVHRRVIAHYRNSGDPALSPIGVILDRLRAARNTCDYDDTVDQLEVQAELWLADAGWLMTALE